MKWEILKGSEKDFEGMTDDILSILENDLGDRYPFHLSAIAPIGRWLSVAERRPITEPVVNQQLTTEWSGEGLPPVGAVVETANRDNFYVRPTVPDDATRVRIVAHAQASNGTPVAIYQWHDEEGAVCVEATVEEMFRPIRSAEDVAREKVRSEECDKIFSILSGVERQGNRSDMAEAIYDAGYRKVE